MRTVRYSDVCEHQPAPHATLSQGAAGTAYALWRLGEKRRAAAWLTAALNDRRSGAVDRALSIRARRSSTMFGVAGIRWVHAVVSGGERVDAYLRDVRRGASGLECAYGAAGHLLGALVLNDLHASPRLTTAIEQIAGRLLPAVERRTRRSWRSRDATGFAHRWPGILYAVLAWHEVRHIPIPLWLHDGLGRLAAVPSADASTRRQLKASWCNGAAGATLLWAKAYACTDDRAFRRAARRSARTAIAASGRLSSLCCGDV